LAGGEPHADEGGDEDGDEDNDDNEDGGDKQRQEPTTRQASASRCVQVVTA